MGHVQSGILIDKLTDTLGCPQHLIARLMGVDPHTLSNNREELLESLTPRTRRRLAALYEIAVRHLGTLRADAVLEILQTHIFEDEEGRRDSVVSALQQDKYPLSTLLEIAELARTRYQDRWISGSPDVSDAVELSA